jgi:signal transduction histidine kinase
VRRVWSIRARTALAFALTSMALAAAAIVVVNLGSQRSIAEFVLPGAGDPTDTPGDREPQAAVTRAPASGTPGGTGVPTDASSWSPDDTRRTTAPSAAGSTVGSVDDLRGVPIVSVVAELQWQWSVVGIGGAGVLAGGTGWLLSRRMLAPIDRIRATADRISASTLHERIGLEGPDDELRRLSRTVDGLLDRLERAFASQRHFVAQASHELRTPLAVQRAALQIGLPDDADPEEIRRARDELLEQNRRTEHLVESLLVLAEAERGLDGRTEPVDLAALADDVVAGSADAARSAGVRVAVHRRGPTTQAGEPVLLRQLLHNLVDNAVEYNRPGGTVDVVVDADRIRVENTGAVLDPEVVATLTEPFRRAAPTVSEAATGPGGTADAGGTGLPVATAPQRRHSGLGLSIVVAVATAHGWRVDVEPRPTGGLVVTVDLRADVSSM